MYRNRGKPLSSTTLGSLSNNVFERGTSTGSGLFSFFDGGFAQTNFISSRHVKRENTSLPVYVRRSKTSLLKLPIVAGGGGGDQILVLLLYAPLARKKETFSSIT